MKQEFDSGLESQEVPGWYIARPPIENMRMFPSCLWSTLIYYIHFSSVTLKIVRWNLLSKTVFGRLSKNEWLDESGWTTHYPYFPLKLIFWNLELTSWLSALPYFKYFSNLMEKVLCNLFTTYHLMFEPKCLCWSAEWRSLVVIRETMFLEGP